ncbi:MAG: sigma-70 family RNA polymerase sigma factor [Ruminococcus sp.]
MTLFSDFPPKYRDSIYLYYFEELSVQEIAELTNIKENTIKTHLKRGREQLKDMIML